MTNTRLALIDYGSGNLHSAARALAAADPRAQVAITSAARDLADATHIVLPGVGHFADCANAVRARAGLIEALETNVIDGGKPFLGICVGAQLMATLGLEDGATPGLNWIGGEVALLERPNLRVPHVGWNALEIQRPHPVLNGLGENPHFYFTHSYALHAANADDVAATTDYGGAFVSAVARNNLFGAQFHPEKSQTAGLKLLANFIAWRP